MSNPALNQPPTDDGPLPVEKPATTKPPRKRWRWILGTLLVIFVGILFLPNLLVTAYVLNPILSRLLKDRITATVGGVHVGWFGPLSVTDLHVAETSGEQVITAKSLATEKSLLPLLRDPSHVGDIIVDSPTVNLTFLEQGTNFHRVINALKPPDAEPSKKKKLPTDAAVILRDLRFVVRSQDELRPLVDAPFEDLVLHYRAAEEPQVLELQPGLILDQAALTPELFQYGLQFILPILSDTTIVEGEISLRSEGVTLPLEQPAMTSGTAQLTIHSVAVGTNSALAKQIAQLVALLFGKEAPERMVLVDGSIIDVTMKDRVITHRGAKFGLPQIHPRLVIETQGDVGLDKSLDLQLMIPVPRGLAENSANTLLESDGESEINTKIIIPIRGTIEKPEVQWNTVAADVAALLRRAPTSDEDAPSATDRALNIAADLLQSQADGNGSEAAATAIDLAGRLGQYWQARRQKQAEQETTNNDEANNSNQEIQEDESPDTQRRPLRRLLDRLRKPD